ncbi:cbf nf-y family transcription factor [Botrytis cinerea]
MDNECDCSSRTRGVSKAPIPIGDYDTSSSPTLSASSCKKYTHCQKTEVSPSPKQSNSSTTSGASYFRCNESDHYYSDLDLTCIPHLSSYHRSLYLHKKHTLWAEALNIPRRISSLAFGSSLNNMEKVCSTSRYLSASPGASDSSRSSSRLDDGGKRLEYVQKVLEDIRTWHKEFQHKIHKQQTHPTISAFMDPLQQNISWTQVFNRDHPTSRRYTSKSLCPESNHSTLWKIDPIPSSIYKSKRMQFTGTKRSPRPVPRPRTSSLRATITPRRRNAIRGRILPKPVSIVYPAMKQHTYQPQETGIDPCNSGLDCYFDSYWDNESSLAGTQDDGKIDDTDSPPTVFEQTKLTLNTRDQSYKDIGYQGHKDGISHGDTVVRLSARHSSLQASESILKTPFLLENEEERARQHIALVHSALRNLVPFEISDYLYRISQSSEICNSSEETFLNSFSDTAPQYIRSNSTFQSSESRRQDRDSEPGIATVQKIVTEILPASSGLAFGKDARDLLIECCVEFITLISSEANEISEKESKKLSHYVKDIVDVASEHKEQLKGREKKANKLEQSGLTAEQLLAMQEEAFRDAAQRHG